MLRIFSGYPASTRSHLGSELCTWEEENQLHVLKALFDLTGTACVFCIYLGLRKSFYKLSLPHHRPQFRSFLLCSTSSYFSATMLRKTQNVVFFLLETMLQYKLWIQKELLFLTTKYGRVFSCFTAWVVKWKHNMEEEEILVGAFECYICGTNGTRHVVEVCTYWQATA